MVINYSDGFLIYLAFYNLKSSYLYVLHSTIADSCYYGQQITVPRVFAKMRVDFIVMNTN